MSPEITTTVETVDLPITGKDISSEAWREYDFGGRVYRIDKPRQLYVGHTTHRVVDSFGITHCIPAPGQHGCALRWLASPPVSF